MAVPITKSKNWHAFGEREGNMKFLRNQIETTFRKINHLSTPSSRGEKRGVTQKTPTQTKKKLKNGGVVASSKGIVKQRNGKRRRGDRLTERKTEAGKSIFNC